MRFPFVIPAIKGLFLRPSTERYPFVKKEAPEGYRGKIDFHPDRCIACGMCIRVCSPGAISMVKGDKTEEGENITMNFNLNSCTFCQMCADFCPKKSIEMTREYSMVATDKNELIVTGSFVKKAPQKPASKISPKAEQPQE
jgi:formate hydrogenlyase subunit 6/NADH:ubiquinone oxidoreductase subunit I